MGTVLVVVIAGVIIAGIAAATLTGDPKPATTPARHRRGARRRPARPRPQGTDGAPATTTSPAAAATPALEDGGSGGDPADDAPADGEPDERPRWHHVRSTALLVVTVVVLGALAAGLLGAAVLLGYRALDGALG